MALCFPQPPLFSDQSMVARPCLVLILLMVYAMMEFTVTLLQRPPANRKRVADDELRRRLLALNTTRPLPIRWSWDRTAI